MKRNLPEDEILKLIADPEKCSYEVSEKKLKVCLEAYLQELIKKKYQVKPFSKNVFLKLLQAVQSYYGNTYDDPNQLMLIKVEQPSDQAVNYFAENLNRVLADAIRYLFIESAYKASLEKNDTGFYIGGKTEQKIFDDLLKNRLAEEKKRIKIHRSASGNKYWTETKKRELLAHYNELLPLTREAKKRYRYLIKQKVKNPFGDLKKQFTELPADIVEQVQVINKKISPKQIVLDYLSKRNAHAKVNYLHNLLDQTRRETNREKASR